MSLVKWLAVFWHRRVFWLVIAPEAVGSRTIRLVRCELIIGDEIAVVALDPARFEGSEIYFEQRRSVGSGRLFIQTGYPG